MNIQYDMCYLDRPGGPRLAYIHTPSARKSLPAVMFLGGYRSDMAGTKALHLEAFCRARGQEFLRFDYSGHGASDGRFEDGTIGSWARDARDVFDHIFTDRTRPVVLVGSSMGGWMALLLARERAARIAGLIGIAAAPDFTQEIFARLGPAQKDALMRAGRVDVPNDYSDTPYYYTRAFHEESEAHYVLDAGLEFLFPVRLLQGKQDKDVPWRTAERIAARVKTPDMKILYVEDGDHRLSRPQDLARLETILATI